LHQPDAEPGDFLNDQFQHVMVLTSIIIGLGITQLLIGVGALIDQLSEPGRRIRPSLTHGAWCMFVFLWLVSFWWWQFRLLSLVSTWTIGRYLFIILYAVLLFMLVVILVPRDWTNIEDVDAYFLVKRYWFFAVFALANVADLIDSYLKGGWIYISATGVFAILLLVATLPVCIIGFRSQSMRVHAPMAIMLLILQVLVNFNAFAALGL
jgi:hypothetical protein